MEHWSWGGFIFSGSSLRVIISSSVKLDCRGTDGLSLPASVHHSEDAVAGGGAREKRGGGSGSVVNVRCFASNSNHTLSDLDGHK